MSMVTRSRPGFLTAARLLVPLTLLWALVACSGAPFAAAPTVTPVPSPTPDPCAPAAITAYGEQIQPVLTNYFAQLGITQSTPRLSLGVALQSLFDAEKAVNAIAAPDCLSDFAARTTNMMDLYRTSMNQFAAQDETNSLNNMVQADKIRAVIEPAVAVIVSGQVPKLALE